MDQRRFVRLRGRAVAVCLRAVPALALTLICASCGGGGDQGTPTVGLPPTIAPASAIPGPVAAARAVGAEPVIAQTTPPAIATLALRFQPTMKMSVFDRFWPVSVAGVLHEQDRRRITCLVSPGGGCGTRPLTPADLRPNASSNAYLDYPERLNDVQAQFTAFERALGIGAPIIAQWRSNPAGLNPYASAQLYFYYGGAAPYSYRGIPPGLKLLSLQYWFFYPLNYYPTFVFNPRGMLADPLTRDHGNSDYHEGDWEHVTVLVDGQSLAPRFLWMARHNSEGMAIPWSQVTLDHGHPVIYPAFGGHPSYQACGAHRRKLFPVLYVADYVVCAPGLFTFSYAATPLVDLSYVAWGCWPGHFGKAGAGLHGASNFDDPTGLVLVAGPRSPLRQAENKNVCRTTSR